jgi:hypothetical protein
MTDLYPDPGWNFVFGQASPRDRVGIHSFARYDPRFDSQASTADSRKLMLRRSCKVLAHETCDVVERYRRLLDFHRQEGFEDEAHWLDKRLRFLAPHKWIGDTH